METLLEETARRSSITYSTSRLSNLTIQIHGWYIEKGHAINEETQVEVKTYFYEQLPKEMNAWQLTFLKNKFISSVFLVPLYIARSPSAINQTRLWVNLFQANPNIQRQDPDLYLRGLYYLLTFLFLQKDLDEYTIYHRELNQFIKNNEINFTFSSNLLAFQYSYLAALNLCFLNKKYEDAKNG